jgi:uncharacterized protein YodC (DUF2158 family)
LDAVAKRRHSDPIVRIIDKFNRKGVQRRKAFGHLAPAKTSDLQIAEEGRLVSTQEPEPGDEVVLRTGGPVMTVLGSDDDRPRELFCVWFDEHRRRCQGTFSSELLKIVE